MSDVRPPRALAAAVLGVLLLADVAILARVYAFGQRRFFTVDEYQYGHATWLVSRGERPYVDFYEHHFPLSYVLHAPLLPDTGRFSERALALRRIPFAYVCGLALLLALATQVRTRNPFAALLAAGLPFAFGFSLMSLVEYRSDVFAACLLMGGLSLLEANRRWDRRSVAVVGGLLVALSAGMSQKFLVVAVAALTLYVILDRLGRRRSREAPLLRRPVAVVAACACALLSGLAAAAAAGVLERGFEVTFLDALRHEQLYPEEASSLWTFAEPFLAFTWPTTLPMLAFACWHGATRPGRFWLVPVLAALAGAAYWRAQFPYNYVLLCLLLMLLAVRGFARAVEARRSRWRPLAYCLPLLALPNQLGFVGHAMDNGHQIALLDKIQALTGPEDAVIDGAGGALFRPHGSYYFLHGRAHRRMFADYFSTRLIEDYRRSRALFWIDDFRQRALPAPVRRYFEDHYVQIDGLLHVHGRRTEPTDGRPREMAFEVLRPGTWFVLPEFPPEGDARPRVDGRPVDDYRVELDAGMHRVFVPPHSPAYVISPLPPRAIRERVASGRSHTLLFQYEWRQPPRRR